MTRLTLAHLSDLHLGQSAARRRAAALVVNALLEARVDHVVVTGDITHSGRLDDYRLFETLFAPLARSGRLTVIPGNHDRGTDDVAERITEGRRVWVESRPGLHLVCVDSTAPHNRTSFRSHGELCDRALSQIDEQLAAGPDDACKVVLLHHHLVPLPVEHLGEWFSVAFGWPHASELALGRQLLQRALGHCDLVLHGHRHVPRQFRADAPNGRALQVFNAGSSTELLACRVFTVEGRQAPPTFGWLEGAPAPRRSPVRLPQPVSVLALEA